MPEQLLKDQIIDWLKNQDYWFQYASKRLLDGEKVTNELVTATYLLFKEDYGLKEKENQRDVISFSKIADIGKVFHKELQLKIIKDIKNVNALASGQTIAINSNLTIIYGGNGTGKSGYIRLLNNAFNSRGDKLILPNVFTENSSGEPFCQFSFQTENSTIDLEYPKDRENITFTQFSVFDSQSVRSHLEQDNKLNFTPIGFEFFEDLLKLFNAVREELLSEISLNQPINNFAKHFINENLIQSEIHNLRPDSDIELLKEFGKYTEADAEKLEKLTVQWNKFKALDITQKIMELQNLRAALSGYKTRQQAILDSIKSSEIENFQDQIKAFHELQKLVRQEGITSLQKYDIDALGSTEWRNFIKSSKSYADLITKSKANLKEYPSKEGRCLFCLQSLSEKEAKLINSYWRLLKSESEAELDRVTQRIQDTEYKLNNIFPVNFNENSQLYNYIKEYDESLANYWKELGTVSETALQNVIHNLSNRKWEKQIIGSVETIKDYDLIAKRLSDSIEDLIKVNPAKELENVEIQINYLKDKNLLSRLLNQILKFVETHKWAAKAIKHLSLLGTRSITIKQGDLFTEHITDKYVSTFNKECEHLNAPKVVDIVQRKERVSTLRKLKVAGQVANNILSEGEQRAISLADFLTEIQLNPYNKGIIFDDPVNSQDHIRSENIARRLVEIAKQRQIIVFTHDIAFFVRLKMFAENYVVSHEYTTIRNAGGTPGIIKPDLPWVVQPIKSRIGTLKDKLVRLKKTEENLNEDEDEYFFAAKAWYILLREAWERAVEERLFKGVVQRFSYEVQTLRLKNVVVTSDLLNEIESGMTESSKWLHDAAAGLNPKPPDTNKAENDLQNLEEFANKCKAN